jgi:thiosulfate dehydrogenase (quinone) large subunit
MPKLSPFQRIGLIALRTVVGWHFLYEGYYKVMLPGWTRLGQPVSAWSAAGYLAAATGPLAPIFRWMAHTRVLGVIDAVVPAGLLLVGVSLVVGLLTQAGCVAALSFLTVFYLSAIPTAGIPQPGAEGAYLIVNKNLVEMAALVVVLSFRTGGIAGLDVLRR